MTTNAVIPAGGQNWKDPVRVSTTGVDIVLAGGAPNVLDGIALAVKNRVLVQHQSSAPENGLYEIQVLGSGADGTWVRTTDANKGTKLLQATAEVEEGTLHGDKAFFNAADAPIVLGVTPITFIPFGVSLATSAPLNVSRTAAVVGVSPKAARDDHKHDIDTAAPGTIQADDSASEGVATTLARSDHKHSIVTDPPVDIAQANSEGTAASFARSDHVHAHGVQPLGTGTNHAVATMNFAGFMSAADKSILDNISGEILRISLVNSLL